MACDELVIGSDTEPVQEVIQSGVNGLLVDYFNNQGMINAVSRALNEANSLQSLRVQARKTIRTHYDLQDNLNQHRELMETVAAGQIPVLS